MRQYLSGKKKVNVTLKVEEGDKVFANIACRSKDVQAIREKLMTEADALAERRRVHEQTVNLFHLNINFRYSDLIQFMYL